MKRIMAVFLSMVLFLDLVAVGLIVILKSKDSPQIVQEETQTQGMFSKLSFAAVGDNLIHEQIYKQAASRSIDGYDFSYTYEYVKDIISNADFAMLNQESLISSEHNISGFPQYNSPQALADEVTKIGFNVINMANNHCLDYGELGLVSSYGYWKQKNAIITGVYDTKENAGKVTVADVNGIKVAFLGFTQDTNDKKLPEDSSSYIVYAENESDLYSLIHNAKENADVVIVMAHWGIEYSNEVSASQAQLAQKLANWGADVIIGSNPHVIQSVEYLIGESGNRTLVAYSLGNFISASSNIDELLGGLLLFNATKNNVTGEVSIDSVSLDGCVTHYSYGGNGIRVYPLSEYTDDLAKRHGVYEDNEFTVSLLKKKLVENFNID